MVSSLFPIDNPEEQNVHILFEPVVPNLWSIFKRHSLQVTLRKLQSGCAALSGNPLYPLARTGPVVPAHAGDDREQGKLSGRVGSRTLSRAARS